MRTNINYVTFSTFRRISIYKSCQRYKPYVQKNNDFKINVILILFIIWSALSISNMYVYSMSFSDMH